MELGPVSSLALQRYCQMVLGLKIQDVRVLSKNRREALEVRLRSHAAECLELPPEALKFLKSSGSLPAVKPAKALPWTRCFYRQGDDTCFLVDARGGIVTVSLLDESTQAAFNALLAKVESVQLYPPLCPFEVLSACYEGEEALSSLDPPFEAIVQWLARAERPAVVTRILLDSVFAGLGHRLRTRFPRFQIRQLPSLHHLSTSDYPRHGVFLQLREMLVHTQKPYAQIFVLALKEHGRFVLLSILDVAPDMLDATLTEHDRSFPAGRIYAYDPKASPDKTLTTFSLQSRPPF